MTLIKCTYCGKEINNERDKCLLCGKEIPDIANSKSNLVKITDMLGQETPYRKNTPLFYIYDDGTVEKRIVIE